jgi:hypothetical protein
VIITCCDSRLFVFEENSLFFPCCLEERGYVSFRDDQGVAGRNGKAIKNGDGKSVRQNDSGFVRRAEGAWFGVSHSGVSPEFENQNEIVGRFKQSGTGF